MDEGRKGRLDEEAVYHWRFAGVDFDEAKWELRIDGAMCGIERKPLEILAELLRHAGELVTKEELLDAVWTGRVVVEGALTNAIGKLRRALRDDAQELIATIPRVGYRLQCQVERKLIPKWLASTQMVPGDSIARRPNWRLARRLDQSERGEVWMAEQIKTHETRVFKFSLDGTGLRALKREATISRLLKESLDDRPDFVRVLDWDFEHQPYFIECDYGGENLEGWSERHGGIDQLPLEQRIAWFAEVADAVAAAHDVGVLHKDLKPTNLLVYGDAAGWHPRVMDFGNGRVLTPERLDDLGITRLGLTQTLNAGTHSLTGTPLYLAPELVAGRSPTVKSDLYALGVILYQLVIGDLRRPLAAGWENDIDDPFLRDDIAESANGNEALRFGSVSALALRLRQLPQRRMKRKREKVTSLLLALTGVAFMAFAAVGLFNSSIDTRVALVLAIGVAGIGFVAVGARRFLPVQK